MEKNFRRWSDLSGLKKTGIIVAAIVVLSFLFNGWGYIGPEKTALKISFGKTVPGKTYNGIHFKIPWFQWFVRYQHTTIEKTEDNGEAYTKDIQTVTFKYTFTYRLIQEDIAEMYAEHGANFEKKKVIPALNDVMKSVIGGYDAQDLVDQRAQASARIDSVLKATMIGDYIKDCSFKLGNLDYSDEFENAVELKVIESQAALKEEYTTAIKKEQAQQKIIDAQADSTITVMNSQAEAMAIRNKAEAARKNPEVFRMMHLENQGKFSESVSGLNSLVMSGEQAQQFLPIAPMIEAKSTQSALPSQKKAEAVKAE